MSGSPLQPTAAFFLPDSAATVALGASLGARLQPGDALLLQGGLGAGKTTLARGAIGAWTGGVEETPSPTYTLVQTYEGPRGTLQHMDLYRLTRPEEVFELGLEDALEGGAAIIEWPERLGPLTPRGAMRIALEAQGAGRLARLYGPPWLRELAP